MAEVAGLTSRTLANPAKLWGCPLTQSDPKRQLLTLLTLVTMMWLVLDEDRPTVTGAFYDGMLATAPQGEAGFKRAARALNSAT